MAADPSDYRDYCQPNLRALYTGAVLHQAQFWRPSSPQTQFRRPSPPQTQEPLSRERLIDILDQALQLINDDPLFRDEDETIPPPNAQ